MSTEFRKSKIAKAISGFAGLMMAIMMVGGVAVAPASAVTVEELTAQINSLLATIAGLQTQLAGITGGTGTGSCAYTFATNLSQGNTGTDVMNLQKVLNMSADTQVSASGAGSPGNESSYFGPATKAAVIKFQNKYASEILTPVGLTAGTGFVGASTRAKLNAMCTATGTETGTGTPTGTGITVSAATHPANSLAPQGASRVPFTKITLTNNSGAAVTVNGITVERTGLGADSAFSGVVLVDDTNLQVGISKTLNSNHQAVVGDTFTLAAGETKNLTVAGNMAADNSTRAGQVVSLTVVAVNTTATVAGSLPITGASHTVNATLTLGSVSTSTSAFDPGAAQTKNVGDTGVNFSGVKFTAGSGEDMRLFSIRWRQVGSVASTDLSNVMTLVDGTSYPTVIDSTGKYYTTTFSGGLLIAKGNSVDVYVKGDISGSNSANRTADFDIDKVTDVYFVGQTYGYGVAPSGTYTPWYNGRVFTINPGSATTISKATEVPAQNIAVNISNQVLGGFKTDFKGESVSVTSLAITIATTSGFTGNGPITGISIYNQAGTVVAGPLDEATTCTSGCTVTFTDTITFPTGSQIYTIKGKIPSGVTDGATVIVSTTPSGWGSPTGQTSGATVTISQANFAMNTMTVKAGSLAVAVSSSPAAQSIVAGAQGVTFANYQFDATQSGEDVRFSSMVGLLDGGNNAYAGTATNLSSCQLFDGSTALNGGSNVVNPAQAAATSTESTGTTHTFTFDSSLTVTKGTVKTLALKCNVSSGADAASKFQFGIANTAANIIVTGISSGSAITETVTAANGQLMTIASGSLVASLDASSPSYKIAAAGSAGVKLGSYKFRATNDAVSLTRVGLGLGSVTASSTSADLTMVTLKSGSNTIGTAVFVGANRNATSTLSTPLLLAKDVDVVVDVYGDLAAQGTSQASNPGALLTVNVDTN
ncbi:MAG: peptidoglycan-binding domain-containing protein, partial [Patescibacteria group bacterium]